jgi:carbamoyltransferase
MVTNYFGNSLSQKTQRATQARPVYLQMNILGIAAGFHDAAATVLSPRGEILFAGHSERYSKKKNDAELCLPLIQDAIAYGGVIDHVAYYERPWLKQLRQLYSGQGIEWNKLSARRIINDQLNHKIQLPARISTHNHHLSHAAGGFQTSPFDRATVVVIDAVGEFDTVTIWAAEYDKLGKANYKKLWSQRYPHSIGLFYSAVTSRVGLRPLDEEYILMGMAAYGERGFGDLMKQDLVDNEWEIRFKQNLHAGLEIKYLSHVGDVDIAAGAQDLVEDLIMNVMSRARGHGWSKNLVYAGGVALNCSANRRLGELFDNIWIMPCPGDAGSSLGAAAMAYGGRIDWRDAFLGHDISGAYPVNAILDELVSHRIVGVASGRAEFGPRALGNRSLLADPRGPDIKNQVNGIKRRQQFRPFAPVILEELADMYFDMPRGFPNSRYMQCIARCRHPELFPAIIHADGTSRVQTVPRDGSGIRELLEKWYVMTGCPMLLNTSLNIRGEPMVNDRKDADRFENLYGVKVCS